MGFNSLGLWIMAVDANDRLRAYVLTDVTSGAQQFTFDNSKQLEVSLYDSLGNAILTATALPGGTTRGIVTRNIPPANQPVSIASTINVLTLSGSITGILAKDFTSAVQTQITSFNQANAIISSGEEILGTLTYGIDGLTLKPTLITELGGSLQVGGSTNPLQQDANNDLQTSQRSMLIDGVVRKLSTTANHLTGNGTTTLTALTGYVSSVVITTDAAGTGSSITIQDKSATPKKLVNAAVTTAISTTPTVLSLPQGALMSSGIDIVTTGAVAATVDIWVDYWQ
jgi:hypothetical protein